MQNDSAGPPSADENLSRSTPPRETESDLRQEIERVAAARGVPADEVARAVRESILEVEQSEKEKPFSREERRSHLLGLTVWRLFGRSSGLWIPPRTESGNTVPPDLLAEGYRMWIRAQRFAAWSRVDSAGAAQALVRVIHDNTDKLAEDNLSARAKAIRALPNFLFISFKYGVLRLATKQGSDRRYYVEWRGLEDVSDKGVFKRILENHILCNELVDVMPPEGRGAAISRQILGYDWQEVADTLETSVNAAQKAQTVAFQRAYYFCTKQIRRIHRPRKRAEAQPPSGGDTSS